MNDREPVQILRFEGLQDCLYHESWPPPERLEVVFEPSDGEVLGWLDVEDPRIDEFIRGADAWHDMHRTYVRSRFSKLADDEVPENWGRGATYAPAE